MSLAKLAAEYAFLLHKQAELNLQNRPKDFLKNRMPSTLPNQPKRPAPIQTPFTGGRGLKTKPKPLPFQGKEQNRFKLL